MLITTFKLFTESLNQPVVMPVVGRHLNDFLALDTYHEDGTLDFDSVYRDYDDDDEEEYEDEEEITDLQDGSEEGDAVAHDEQRYFAKLMELANDYIGYNVIEELRGLNLGIEDLKVVEHVPYNGAFYPSVNFQLTMDDDWEESFEYVFEGINPKRLHYFLTQDFADVYYSTKEQIEEHLHDSQMQGVAIMTVALFLIGRNQCEKWKTEMNDTIREALTSNMSKYDFID